ncbi:MAG: ATP synthase F1 subunit gamma [Lachnospiraceae bacterium]|nr:ATP synthase F1 subunit gamma [Lachnospiraceae bacterium]
MAGAKLIRERMDSIRDTMKITNAMYLISSSKLNKAKTDLENARPHYEEVVEDISRLQRHLPATINNRYFKDPSDRSVRTIGYVLITADKGLAGAYNMNVIKLLQKELDQNPDCPYVLYVVGQIGRVALRKRHLPVDEMFQYTAQNPSVHRARVISGRLLEDYKSGRIGEIRIIYTSEVSAIESEAKLFRLLPLEKTKEDKEKGVEVKDDFEFLPSPEDVFHSLIPNYMTSVVYGTLIESFKCEQNARMIAMQAATDNATKMLQSLQLDYNRARQSGITQQITEVSGGARAQKKKKEMREKS